MQAAAAFVSVIIPTFNQQFPERYSYAEDYKLWWILSRLGRVVCPEQIVYRHRQHPIVDHLQPPDPSGRLPGGDAS